MRVEIDDGNGSYQISRKLIRFADNAEDASPAFHQIARQIEQGEQRQFDSSGRYGSGGWQPLAPATVQRKLQSPNAKVRANAQRILRATGDTEASLTGNGPGSVEIVQPHQLTKGTTVPQAKYHQPDPQGRRVLEIPETGRRDIVRTLQRFLTGSLDGAAARGLT